MFDTNKEERHGAWVVLVLYGVVAAVPPLACLWMVRALESGSGPHSGMGAPLFLGGLAFAGLASLALGLLGTVLVIYGVVRMKMHGPFYPLGCLLATFLALTPVLLGWNELNEPPAEADFDPGDCAACAAEGAYVLPWGSSSIGITGSGECRSGRRDGVWIFRGAENREMASFAFANGVLHGPFETETIRGAYADGMRDGDWSWQQFGRTMKRGRYVEGLADGRWLCLDRDGGEELSWVLFDRGEVVEGNGNVYVGGYVESSSDAVSKLVPDGIFCDDPEPTDMFFRRMFEF